MGTLQFYEKRKPCSRTPLSSLQIFLFYICFYSFLAGYWSLCFYVFWSNFITDEPTYILDQSVIGVKPGVGIVPRLPEEFNYDHGRTYHYFLFKDWKNNFNNDSNDYIWVNHIHQYFENLPSDASSVPCNAGDHEYHESNICQIDMEKLGQECTEYPYGYSNQNFKPCLFLKLNRIYKFKPEPFALEQFKSFSSWINTTTVQARILEEPKKVYLSCHGINEETEQKIAGKFNYFPSDGGISFRYFPYHNLREVSQSPLVAIQLEPDFPRNEELIVDCYAFFKGVVHDHKTRQGFVRFHVKIIDP